MYYYGDYIEEYAMGGAWDRRECINCSSFDIVNERDHLEWGIIK
jgi:hypothetical protein